MACCVRPAFLRLQMNRVPGLSVRDKSCAVVNSDVDLCSFVRAKDLWGAEWLNFPRTTLLLGGVSCHMQQCHRYWDLRAYFLYFKRIFIEESHYIAHVPLRTWAVYGLGWINTKNESSASGNRQLPHKIMTTYFAGFYWIVQYINFNGLSICCF